MSDCFVLYLLLTCMKKKTSGADKFTNNTLVRRTEIAYEARLREISWRKTVKSNNYHICRSRVNAADL